MKVSLRKGISYGTTSGVITTLGLLIGLYSISAGRNVVLAGILTIAFADAFSDGLGIHISEEAENHHSKRSIWESTFSTILSKMALGISFIIAVLLFPLDRAILINIIYGIFVLSILSYLVARQNNEKPQAVLLEHLGIACLVIIGSYLIGKGINYLIS